MIDLAPEQVRKLRLRAQRLHPRAPRATLIDAVRAVVGIQAQSLPAMMLALRARVAGLTLGDVTRAVHDRPDLVRTSLMRGTLHLSAAEDVRWLIPLLGPAFARAGRRRRLQLGLDDAKAARGVAEIRALLGEHGPMTRDALVAALNARGVALDRKSQAPIHLIRLVALEGFVCYGPDTARGEETFVLFEAWAGPPTALPEDAALAELARRYVRGYGPASLPDFVGWSGLGMAAARRAWEAIRAEPDFAGAQIDGLEMLTPASALAEVGAPADSGAVVQLLPAFDAYILGYAERQRLVRSERQGEVYHGGQTVPVVLVDGEAAGVWRYKRQGKRLAITVQAFDAFTPEVQRQIAEEADDIGRFWEVAVSLRIEPQ
ncbi:MAG: winged helix DNA-binding domain-containing protein [Anaerolineae bacterium]|nr:winged helix DNA-binding domain-containing protein [Anaerolineae bacterium]